jgi:hypothetical protein
MQELFYTSGMRILLISVNGTCVKKVGRRKWKKKLLAREMKYWLRLLEMNYTHPLGDVLGQKNRKGATT